MYSTYRSVFVRGSLYFNNIPNQDSIQPVLDFIKQDIEHIFETFDAVLSGSVRRTIVHLLANLDWDNYKDYTGASTKIADLKPGWYE